jgi:hypothetical protein
MGKRGCWDCGRSLPNGRRSNRCTGCDSRRRKNRKAGIPNKRHQPWVPRSRNRRCGTSGSSIPRRQRRAKGTTRRRTTHAETLTSGMALGFGRPRLQGPHNPPWAPDPAADSHGHRTSPRSTFADGRVQRLQGLKLATSRPGLGPIPPSRYPSNTCSIGNDSLLSAPFHGNTDPGGKPGAKLIGSSDSLLRTATRVTPFALEAPLPMGLVIRALLGAAAWVLIAIGPSGFIRP